MQNKNIKTFILCLLLSLFINYSGYCGLSTVYNISTPAGTDDPRLADDEMRLIKAAVQERMNDHNGTADEGDHYWPITGTQVSNVDTGQHRMITLRQMTGNPSALTSYSTITDLGFLFQKDVDGNGELFWQDETGADGILQLTTNGLFNLNSAIWDGVFATSTSDAGDSKSVSLTSGGAYGVGRGAGIILYGNEHATNPGQLILEAGYSTGTTKAVIDVKTSVIDNVGTPTEDDHAATKEYVDSKVGLRATASKDLTTVYTAGTDGILVVITGAMDDSDNTIVYSDDNADPTTIVAKWTSAGNISGGNIATLTVPILNTKKYKVTATVAVTSITWYPIGE